MVVLLSTTIISCSQALAVINRMTGVVGLSNYQKIEIIKTLRDSIPSCPIKVEIDERSKLSPRQ